MRDFTVDPGEGADLDLLNGEDMTTPLTQFDLTDDGAAMQTVHSLGTSTGEAQGALTRGGFGALKRAGNPG